MSTKIDMVGIKEFDLRVEPDRSGYGQNITLTITSEGGDVVVFDCGRFNDDLHSLTTDLEALVEDAKKECRDWEDLPDEYDAYIGAHWGRFFLTIEQVHVGDQKGYPTREIAAYELARHMTESGVFPGAWFQNERGTCDAVDDEVRAFHDEGGTGLKPLPGVRFEDGAEVLIAGMGRAYVVKDYGDLGLTYVLSGDDEVRFIEDNVADAVLPYPDEDEDGD